MKHTDDLRERVAQMIQDCGDHIHTLYCREQGVDDTASEIISAVHADIAARAMSEEVIEAVWTEAMDAASVAARNSSEVRSKLLVNATITALLLALGITESEAEK